MKQTQRRRHETRQPHGPATQEKPQDRYANGDVWCQVRQRRIEPVICTIQSFREPRKCSGCRYAEGNMQRTNKKEVRV